MLNKILTEVLMETGKLTLPSIGIIVKLDVDDNVTYLFTPSHTKANTRLVEMIMKDMDLDYDDASNILDSYIEFVKNIIAKNGKYHLKDIGYIAYREDGGYTFRLENEPDIVEKSVDIVSEIATLETESKESGTILTSYDEVAIEEIVIEEIAIAEQASENIDEEVINDISNLEVNTTENELCFEENETPTIAVIDNELVEEPQHKSERINERTRPKILGETIVEGIGSRRFYDKVRSQIADSSNGGARKEWTRNESTEVSVPASSSNSGETYAEQPAIIEEVVATPENSSKKLSIFDIYHSKSTFSFAEKQTHQLVADEKNELNSESQESVTHHQHIEQPQKVEQVVESEKVELQNKIENENISTVGKKPDYVMIISLTVIALGIISIAIFYFLQQQIEKAG